MVLSFNKKRGLKVALNKLNKELYQKQEWVILKLPVGKKPTPILSEVNIQIAKMDANDADVFEQIFFLLAFRFPSLS